jgi:lambda family phage portal protein
MTRRKRLQPAKAAAPKKAAPFQRVTSKGLVPIEQRHWDGAVRDTEKNSQWCLADGRHINSVLVDSLKTVQDRCLYETRINPTVEGTIETHKNDVVGKDGPKLQVQTDDDAFNEAAERVFREEFCESADSTGKLSVGDYLKLGIESLWNVGTIFSQIIYDNDAETILKTKLHAITPQRLSSPYEKTGDPLHLLGVERNKAGRPRMYHITEDTDDYRYGYPLSFKTIAIPASQAICEFKMHQEGQVLGFPWLSSSLQCQEDLRGYDQAVLDAAKTAAILAVLAYSTGDMAADPPDGANTIDPRRFTPGAINFMPEQWQPMMLNPTQPANNHVEYRSERQREIGRPVGMPLMQIRLDSSGHNYSSARFDASIYNRANTNIQNWLERRILKRMFRLVMAESMLLGLLPKRNVKEIPTQWNWDQPPHVDPVKEAMAERIRLENRTLSPQLACAGHGIDFEQLCHDWKRANDILKKNGLPEMLGPVPGDLQSLKAYLETGTASEQAA